MLRVVPQRDNFAILLFKCDEGGDWHSQLVELHKQIVDDLVLLSHRIKVVIRDKSATLSQSQD